jgi:ankyrin repeat protein
MLIEKGANVNQANNRGCTPLKIACDHSILRIVQILLKNNVDVNQTDSDGRSPLYFCSTNSNYHCVDIAINLIRAGANLNLRSRKYHRTALHQAAAIGNFDIITLLLDCNAHLTPIDKNGRTPEDIAWICGYSHCAEYLKRRRLWQRRKGLYLIKTSPETSNGFC